MDFHPPQGAHTSYLRTLSKIMDLRGFVRLAPQDISSKGARYYTTNFLFVNTPEQTFFAPRHRAGACGVALRWSASAASHRRGAHLTSVRRFVNTLRQSFFCDRTSRAAERRRCSAMQLARNRCARLAVARGAGLRAPRRGARARTTACPPAATVRRPPRRSARDRRPRRHRCAVRARQACA